MKSPLFWKIFLSFWLTTVVISQASWLIYSMFWDTRPSWEREISENMADVELAAGRDALARSGIDGLASLRAALPDRGVRLRVLRPGEHPDPRDDRMTTVTVAGHGPATLAFRLVPDRKDTFDLLSTLYRSSDYLIASLLGGIVFAAVLALYMIRPVQRLRDGFDRLAGGDLSVRLVPAMGRRRDEIADLAGHFDRMAVRLEQLVSVRDQLLHDVSHEFRSPLARMTLAIALQRKRPDGMDVSLARIEREIARLDDLVAELLSLARAEGDASHHDGYFDLVDLVGVVVSTSEVEATAAGVAIALHSDANEYVIRGNAELMRRAVENILRNAIRVSERGGRVTVVIRTAGTHVELDIGDRGPGVPVELLERIFEPFQRGAARKDGTGYGLGLTIARRAILSHGGAVSARNLVPHGLLVTIRLPCVPEASEDQAGDMLGHVQ